MDAQGSLAAGVLADLKAQADANSTTTAAILGTLGDDVVDQALRNAIIPKEFKLEMSTPGVVLGIFPRGRRWQAKPQPGSDGDQPYSSTVENRPGFRQLGDGRPVPAGSVRCSG